MSDTVKMPAGTAESLAKTIAEERVLAFLPGIMQALPEAEWFLVGGAVRDHVLGRTARKDYDLVVRKVTLETLQPALAKLGRVDLVGRDFGVLRFVPEGCEGEEPVDIAWPRTEKAGGSGGYRDFKVQADPDLALERDLARRDFTMNAVAFDFRTHAFIDPYEGLADIAAKTVRAVGEPSDRFAEDLSRILRGVRLACELGFTIEKTTWDAIVALAPRLNDMQGGEPVVPRETVARNLVRALAADPVRAVDLFDEAGILEPLIPQIAQMRVTAQPAVYHSEGDVWTHTKLALAALRSPAFSELFPGEAPDAETILAVLFHDIAKPETGARREDPKVPGGFRISFHGHDVRGADMTRGIARDLRLSSVPEHEVDEERLVELVRMHLFPNKVDSATVRRTTLVRHFLRNRQAGRRLLHLAFADASAALRPDGSTDTKNLRALIATLAELEAQGSVEEGKVKTVLSGEDIMQELHLQPGPEVGRLLVALQEAQLTGKVATADDAKKFLLAQEKEA